MGRSSSGVQRGWSRAQRIGAELLAPPLGRSRGEYSSKSARSRQISAAATITVQVPANVRNQTLFVSVPFPSECANAIGHSRYVIPVHRTKSPQPDPLTQRAGDEHHQD